MNDEMNTESQEVKPYDWIPFFGEISERLVKIGREPQSEQERNQATKEIAEKIFKNSEPILSLDPIDPLSIIYTLASKSNPKYFQPAKENLNLGASVPTDFVYPSQTQRTLFANHRLKEGAPPQHKKAVNELWEVFLIVTDGKDRPQLSNEECMNCIKLPGVGVALLSQALFLVNPYCYLPLDKNSSIPVLSKVNGSGKESDIERKIKTGAYLFHDVLKDIRGIFPDWKPWEINFYVYVYQQGKENQKKYINTSEQKANLKIVEDLMDGYPSIGENNMKEEYNSKQTSLLNRIFYGPPGTGKTYRTINAALEILDPQFYKKNRNDRKELRKRYEQLIKEGRIAFITFHQSFGYEEFVEGIRPVMDGDAGSEVTYEIKGGVFKDICDRAASTKPLLPFEEAIEKLKEKCLEDDEEKGITMKTIGGQSKHEVWHNEGSKTFITKTMLNKDAQPGTVSIKRLTSFYENPERKGSKPRMILKYLKEKYGLDDTKSIPRQNHVLIIDEINRGNISRIFGELITLIEPSKRLGNEEATTVTLPYSGEIFGVPNNLYIIGTMNTADRSIALLDTALRRRFRFEEMMPEYELLKGIVVDGINISDLLLSLNNRIEALYDRGHQIGHSYFMPLEKGGDMAMLKNIFLHEVLPLLQEYFYEDWENINLVLNDNGFLKTKNRPKIPNSDLVDDEKKLWHIDESAFDDMSNYQQIYSDDKDDNPA